MTSCLRVRSPKRGGACRGAAIYVFHPAGGQAAAFMKAFAQAGFSIHQGLVWVKDSIMLGHGDYHYRHEPIVYGRTPGGGSRGRGRGGWYGGERPVIGDRGLSHDPPHPGTTRRPSPWSSSAG